MIENIREIHSGPPVLLTSPGSELSSEEDLGPHGISALRGQPTGARLHVAIQAVLATAERNRLAGITAPR